MTLQQLRYLIAIADYGSMNKAASQLYVSQPSLSDAIHDLEEEAGFSIFIRTNRGVRTTPKGEEMLGYARQVLEQFSLLESSCLQKKVKKHFSVSSQHYTFAVNAFVNLVKQVGMEDYDLAIHETKTLDIIRSVKNLQSELGILYCNYFNRSAIMKILRDNGLEFIPLFTCDTYVYLWAKHPLANQKSISMEELQEYPCLAFDQGDEKSFFLAEEVFSTYDYKRIIRANDRATLLNLMVGLNGYTLCSGIICEELNGSDYKAVPLRLEGTEIEEAADVNQEDGESVKQEEATDVARKVAGGIKPEEATDVARKVAGGIKPEEATDVARKVAGGINPEEATLTIGYIKLAGMNNSELAKLYIEELKKSGKCK